MLGGVPFAARHFSSLKDSKATQDTLDDLGSRDNVVESIARRISSLLVSPLVPTLNL
jgi:hypothetical protein